MPRLLVERGPDRGKIVTVVAGQQIVVGRDPAASFQLADTMCSRRHFLIGGKNGVFGIKDLGSANGTLVNGRRVEGARKLQFGDSIQIGETLLSWLSDEQTEKGGGIVGQTVGGYRIEQRIGRGAMGTVYKAVQLSLGRTVALKVLATDLVKDARFRDMFMKEARAAGGLNHPNIIQVYDVGDDAGTYYFSMEYAAKGSVQDELQVTKRIEIPRAVRIIRDACGALDYAERKGLVHRDIKPDNLMVMEDGSVKLGDLGLAMSAQELQGEQDGVFGTPHYIAPEQAMGKPIDHRADIYALGATFYRMLSGKTIFTGATVKDILKQQVRDPHPSITKFVHDCPEGVRLIMDRMLAKNPAERYQHAGDIANDLADLENFRLRQAFSEAATMAVKPVLPPPQPPEHAAKGGDRRLLGIATVAALLAVASAVAVIWFFMSGGLGGGSVVANNGAVANDVEPKGNGTPLTPEVMEANDTVRSAISVASYILRMQPAPPPSELEQALDDIDNALRLGSRASPDLKQRLEGLREQIENRHKEMMEGEFNAQDEYDKARKEALVRVDAFRFEAAKEPMAEFIAKWSESRHLRVEELVANARSFLATTLGARAQARLEDFERNIQRQRTEAERMPVELRAAEIERLATRARDAQRRCDEELSQARLKTLADQLDELAKLMRADAQREARIALEAAVARAVASLDTTLEQARRDIALGRFVAAGQRTERWKQTDEDFLAYGDKSAFALIRSDLERREAQTRLIFESLQILATAMPSAIDQGLTLLRANPWPAEVAQLVGQANTPLTLVPEKSLTDSQWELQVRHPTSPRSLAALSFDTAEKRLALAAALRHLMQHSEDMGSKLLAETPSGPPAILGVFAWLTELEAHSDAAGFIEYAWQQLASDSEHRPLLREYYAWSLLGQASEAATAGDRARAQGLLKRLEQDFADTRANKPRQ